VGERERERWRIRVGRVDWAKPGCGRKTKNQKKRGLARELGQKRARADWARKERERGSEGLRVVLGLERLIFLFDIFNTHQPKTMQLK
jgi:hypothetical protein